MNKAAQFVMDKSVQPAIDYYEKKIKPKKGIISKEKYEDINEVYKTSTRARTVLSSLIKTGDVYNYLKHIITKNDEDSINRFLRNNLVPIELIIDEFRQKFKKDLDEVFTPDDFVEGNAYKTLTINTLSGSYNARDVGILTIRNSNKNIIGITARGTFGSEGNYANYWIDDNECIYHLISGNHKNNILLLTGKYPIYIYIYIYIYI